MLNEPTQSSNSLYCETQAKQNEKYHTVAQPKDKPTSTICDMGGNSAVFLEII